MISPETTKRGGRYITDEEVLKFEKAHKIQMRTNFESNFLEDFRTRYGMFGKYTIIFPKQLKILNKILEKCL